MGFLDNLFDAVESGALEKRLNQFADAVEQKTKQVDDTLQKAADKPASVLKAAVAKKDAVEAKAQSVSQHTRKSMDIMRKKD